MFKHIKHFLFGHDLKPVIVDFDTYESIAVFIQNGKIVRSFNKRKVGRWILKCSISVCWCGTYVFKVFDHSGAFGKKLCSKPTHTTHTKRKL